MSTLVLKPVEEEGKKEFSVEKTEIWIC